MLLCFFVYCPWRFRPLSHVNEDSNAFFLSDTYQNEQHARWPSRWIESSIFVSCSSRYRIVSPTMIVVVSIFSSVILFRGINVMIVHLVEPWHCSSHSSIEHWSVKTIWSSWFAFSAKSNVMMLFDDFKVRTETWINTCSSVHYLFADYRNIRTPIKETRPSFSDILLDNHEDDKIATQISNEILPCKWPCLVNIEKKGDANFE